MKQQLFSRFLSLFPQYIKLRQKYQKVLEDLEVQKERTEAANNTVQRLKAERVTRPWLRHLNKAYEFANKGSVYADSVKIDVCIAHDTHSLVAADTIRKNTGCRIIYDAVEVPSYSDRSIPMAKAMAANPVALGLISELEATIMNSVDSIIAISPGLGEIVQDSIPNSKPLVVRNCRSWEPAKLNSQIRTDCNCSPDDKLIIILNSVNFGDGLKNFLDVVSQLSPNIKIAMLGGVYRLEEGIALDVMIRKMNLEERVIELDMKPPEELIEYISGSDCTMIIRRPTNLNNVISLPNRIFESVMARAPILVPDIQDMQNITTEFNLGMVYNNKSNDDMVDKINAILDDETNANLRAGLEDTAKQLCWEKEQDNFLKAIDSCEISTQGKRNAFILANKSLERNDRMCRLSKSLTANNYNVTVLCTALPADRLRIPGVTYVALDLVADE